MRSLIFTAVAVMAAVTACSPTTATPRRTTAPQPRASATGSPPQPQPLPEGDVDNGDSTFHLRVGSVRVQHSYSNGINQPEIAKPGAVLIVVKLAEKNTGRSPSNIEFNTPNPVLLVGADGATYERDVDWASSDDINPGLSRTDTYTFDVPSGVKPAAVQVTLIPQSGGASSVELALPL